PEWVALSQARRPQGAHAPPLALSRLSTTSFPCPVGAAAGISTAKGVPEVADQSGRPVNPISHSHQGRPMMSLLFRYRFLLLSAGLALLLALGAGCGRRPPAPPPAPGRGAAAPAA